MSRGGITCLVIFKRECVIIHRMSTMSPLPYRIAVLCYLFDEQGNLLLLHRCKPPNFELYSPIGGKLEQDLGESPTATAIREIHEEVGLTVMPNELHLTGIVSETGFDDSMHWLMFLYELTVPASVLEGTFDEGRLEWHPQENLAKLPIPETDRNVIWPLFWRYRHQFFMAHINCQNKQTQWRIEQPATDITDWSTDPVM